MEKHRGCEVGADAVKRGAARPARLPGGPKWGATKSLQALLVTSYLLGSMNAAGGEPRRERVTLSVDARPREEAHSHRLEVGQEEGVLSLRVVDPGRLVVKAGAEVIAAGVLGWGEDRRLRVDTLLDHPHTALPRVVNRDIQLEEAQILAKTKQLRAAFKLPEVLSGGAP